MFPLWFTAPRICEIKINQQLQRYNCHYMYCVFFLSANTITDAHKSIESDLPFWRCYAFLRFSTKTIFFFSMKIVRWRRIHWIASKSLGLLTFFMNVYQSNCGSVNEQQNLYTKTRAKQIFTYYGCISGRLCGSAGKLLKIAVDEIINSQVFMCIK